MRIALIWGVISAAIIFFQGVPAPPVVIAWSATVGTFIGGIYGVTAGVIADEVKRGKKKNNKRSNEAILYVKRMVHEIAAELDRREDGPGPAPAGVPQYNWDDCFHQARRSRINVVGPIGDNNIRVTGLPPVCMNLAMFLGGTENGTATPIPCGSDCIEYVNMTFEYYEGVRSVINSQPLDLPKGSARRTQRLGGLP